MPAIVSVLTWSMVRESPVWSRGLIAHAHRYPSTSKSKSPKHNGPQRHRAVRARYPTLQCIASKKTKVRGQDSLKLALEMRKKERKKERRKNEKWPIF